MSERYEKPCFDVMDNEGVVECLEGADDAGECCKDATKCNAWAICDSGKLSPHYAEYAAQPTGRKVIADVEGLKEAIKSHSVKYIGVNDAVVGMETIKSIIDTRTITAPDLVRRDAVIALLLEHKRVAVDDVSDVPEWDGKE